MSDFESLEKYLEMKRRVKRRGGDTTKARIIAKRLSRDEDTLVHALLELLEDKKEERKRGG